MLLLHVEKQWKAVPPYLTYPRAPAVGRVYQTNGISIWAEGTRAGLSGGPLRVHFVGAGEQQLAFASVLGHGGGALEFRARIAPSAELGQ